ncbi:PIR protein [Plasmodium yoelii]|uniref:PIR protein n=2 Tax=Plasmodium yoelii TaxID=5861 RepID=A0AAE9WRQ2_PLAYO|nr:PIR protein [Plasmodium yoelii]WBY55877.1 PIR protein [Plasmodium yoelii yoelii]CDU16872.1 YIR protein [Plasmodium yoelii]VTZ75120.1 PIR protein [Plasmodium yoelii]|eukprot:XP_022813110.1 PIR protein [Plasmodium yoelii]
MDHFLCIRFSTLRGYYPDELNISKERDIHNIGGIVKYCPNGNSRDKKCNTELDKINAACLWLFEQNIANRIDDLSSEQVKAFIIYIMIWLNYMLNLKKDGKITALKDFYTNHIENNPNYINCKSDGNDCNSTLNDKAGYNNFKEVIVKNMELSNINFEDISKFYDAFKLLCKMYIEFNEDEPECTKYLEYANNFVDKYKKLNGNSSVTGNISYSQVLCTLSTDYDNFKKKCNGINCMNIPLLPPIKTIQHPVQSSKDHSEHASVQKSDVTSSSLSIVNKLILALSIFGAITVFWGISYKYSLFGFRKRSKKQHLRENLKK